MQYEITNIQGEIDFECGNDFTRRTLQNAKNLLMTRMGEIPFDRQRGLNQRIYDLPTHEAQEALLPELDRVMLWEPDVEVVSAKIQLAGEKTIITCIVEVKER